MTQDEAGKTVSNELVGRCWLIDFATSAMKIVMMKLADCAGDDGSNVFPSVAFLARETQLSTRSVSDQIAALRECGLIADKKDEHGNRINRTSVLREINIDLMAAVSDTRVRGQPRRPSSHVIRQIEVDVPAGATRILVPGALVESTLAEKVKSGGKREAWPGGMRKTWAIVPRCSDPSGVGSTPAGDAGVEGGTPAGDAGAPLQEIQGTPATDAVHPCDSCQQPTLDPSPRPSPKPPAGATGVRVRTISNAKKDTGWAALWTEDARAEVSRVRSSPVLSHVASVFIDALRGTLRPQKGADPAAYVRQLAHHLRDFSPHVLATAATALIEARNETLPGIGDVLKVVRASAEKLKVEAAASAGAVSVSAGDPALAARWPDVVIALRNQLGHDIVKSWFGPVQPLRMDGRVLVLAAPRLHANWIAQHYEEATLSACRSVWPDVGKLKIEQTRVAA